MTQMTIPFQKQRAIFFDLDGVLADLDKALCQLHGRSDLVDNRRAAERSTEGPPYLNMGEVMGMDSKELVQTTSGWWWAQLPMLDWATELVAKAQRIAPHARIMFLTSPPDHASAADAKRDWVCAMFGIEHRRNVIICPTEHKWRTVGEKDMIIDDHPQVIWNCRQTGVKHTWLFPTPFNTEYSEEGWKSRSEDILKASEIHFQSFRLSREYHGPLKE